MTFWSIFILFIYFKICLFVYLLIYLFIYFGCIGSLLLREGFLQLRQAGATLHCGVRASRCGGFSCCGAQALGARASQLQHTGSVVVVCRLQSAGSVVVVCRLSCSAARGIFPDQGSNSCPLHWQTDSLPLRHQGSPLFLKWSHLIQTYSCIRFPW